MHTGEEIIKKILIFVHLHYGTPIQDFNEELDGLMSTDQAILKLNAEPTLPPRIKQLLNCFQESELGIQFFSDPFKVCERVEIIDFNNLDFQKRNRSFSLSDTEFGYLSTNVCSNEKLTYSNTMTSNRSSKIWTLTWALSTHRSLTRNYTLPMVEARHCKLKWTNTM